MSIKLSPYLIFDGTAAKAIELYERALGARTEALQRVGDMPGATPDPATKDRVLHARLRIGDGTVLISDDQPGATTPTGGNVHVCLDLPDLADTTAKFEALAQGGKVTTPLQDTFWGATFGTLTDAYGVQWMFNCNK